MPRPPPSSPPTSTTAKGCIGIGTGPIGSLLRTCAQTAIESAPLSTSTAPEAGAPMEQQGSVVLEPGVGIVGDRYALGTGKWSDPRWHDKELTLFEEEVAAAIGIEAGLTRRNLVTRGIALEGLVGVRFR